MNSDQPITATEVIASFNGLLSSHSMLKKLMDDMASRARARIERGDKRVSPVSIKKRPGGET